MLQSIFLVHTFRARCQENHQTTKRETAAQVVSKNNTKLAVKI